MAPTSVRGKKGRHPQRTSSPAYVAMAARARAQPRSASRSDGSQRWAAQAPAPTTRAWVAVASHRIESPNAPWISSAANASPAPAPATAGQMRRPLPIRSISSVTTRNPAGANSNTSSSGTSPSRSGTDRSSAVSNILKGPPSIPGSRSDRNNGVTASHRVARAYAPASRNVGTPRRKCPPLARTTAVTSRVRGVNTCTNTRRRGARVKPWRAVAALLHSPGSMTTSVHDLGKLRLDRDTPPGVRRAFRRSLILAAVAAGLIAAAVLVVRRGSAVPVQTVVVAPLDAGAGAAGGATAVTANGYVVARTRASVSSKVPG